MNTSRTATEIVTPWHLLTPGELEQARQARAALAKNPSDEQGRAAWARWQLVARGRAERARKRAETERVAAHTVGRYLLGDLRAAFVRELRAAYAPERGMDLERALREAERCEGDVSPKALIAITRAACSRPVLARSWGLPFTEERTR